MVVFLAVPGLQRSQRDTQRRQDVGRLISTITSIQGNTRGQIPADMGDYQEDPGGNHGTVYAELVSGGSRFSDPSTQGAYQIVAIADGADLTTANGAMTAVGQFVIAINASCADNPSAATPFQASGGANNASFAVAMQMEGSVYCQNG